METKDIISKIGTYWDDYATKFDEEHDTEDIEAWAAAFKSCLDAPGPSTVLDLGTGTGFLANMAAAMGHFCVGLDISEKMIGMAANKSASIGAKAVYMLGDIMGLPFAGNAFDYIVNSRLLWTLVEPLQTITHWVSIVRPGGKIICFNRFKEGLGMCGGKGIYGNQYVDQATPLANSTSSGCLLRLFSDAGLVNVEFRRLPNLAKATRAERLDPWHALIGAKPMG
ncbi:MAG: class I SAM-dependent methyltransferase [Deltaproteobacteria bacterium]|nr:class I SAM-dependent methyltransferase [Deltaproteobacteria bacterium]